MKWNKLVFDIPGDVENTTSESEGEIKCKNSILIMKSCLSCMYISLLRTQFSERKKM